MKADSIPRSHHRGVNSPGALRLETLRPGDHLGPAGRSPRALTGPGQGSWGRVLGSRGGVAGSWALGVGSPGHGRPPPRPARGSRRTSQGCCVLTWWHLQVRPQPLAQPSSLLPWAAPCPWTVCSTFPLMPIPRCGLLSPDLDSV